MCLKGIGRESEIPDSMRRNDEADWHDVLKTETRTILNLLLRWRWQNNFKSEGILIVPGMVARFNDTIMPLLKVANLEDRYCIIDYMKKQEKSAINAQSDDFRIKIVQYILELAKPSEGLLGSPGSRIFTSDVIDKAKVDMEGEISDFEFKKRWNPRYVGRAIRDLGFELESYRNKNYIKPASLDDLLPRLVKKYAIKLTDAPDDEAEAESKTVDKVVDKEVDIDIDKVLG